MNDRLFLAARRSDMLVGRMDELEKLRQAIYEPAVNFQVVFLSGHGGVGKSRLVEEVLWRAGNLQARKTQGEMPSGHPEWDWSSQPGKAVAADLLDMSNIQVHTRTGFMHAVRDALVRAKSDLDFSRYDSAYRDLQKKRIRSSYRATQQYADLAETAFLNSYKLASAKERVVLILDTCEKLAYSHSNWLVQENLIAREELAFNVSQWLTQHIQKGSLPNTTLILVGRKAEGKEFFQLIHDTLDAAQRNHQSTALLEVDLETFSLNDTRDYFRYLSEIWETSNDPGAKTTAHTFQRLVDDTNRLWVLWRYTGGQPVRLALYADLIVEGQSIPQRLRDTPGEAKKRLPADLSTDAEKARLSAIQASIEAEIIHLLFTRAGLRAEILKALVRAPRGLNSQQLYLVLQPGPFEQALDHDFWQEIERELVTLRQLSIVKIYPEGRLGLQDEIYHIYARIMARNKQNQDDEKNARQKMAQRLENWAEAQLAQWVKERRRLIDADESKLAFPSPANAHQVNFSHPTERDTEAWVKVREAIHTWNQEKLHYALLSNLPASLNDVVFEMAFDPEIADNEETDFLNLEEVYQVLYDDALLNFIAVPPWRSLKRRHEGPIAALRRMMRQSEVIRWLQRFTYRGDYPRAEKFYHDLEAAIAGYAPDIQDSWNHTFSRGERQIWFEYGRILQGDIQPALGRMTKILADLEILVNTSDRKAALPETGEHGFIGHPGHDRLLRVISLGYNFLGYGQVNLGQLRQAKDSYSLSLKYMRAAEFRGRMAVTLNNLSRTLSDMGRGRARRVCLDGLNLNKDKGADSAIAYSTNTLALIDNDQIRPDLAWIEAATAVAYFRRAENARGLGLAQIQLGEALRRLAGMQLRGAHLTGDSPDSIYEEARLNLEEAIDLFTTGPAKLEVMRQVEARIEMGCLQRDRLQVIQNDELRAQTRANALNELDLAANLARQTHFPRLLLDAVVNRAWVHYVNRDHPAATEALAAAEKLVPSDAILTRLHLPIPERDDSYVFQQLSKIYGLRARIVMDAFRKRVDDIEKPLKDKKRNERYELIDRDPPAQAFLRQATEYYVQAVSYSQLFSPRSSALTAIYDDLYDRLKTFNAVELSAFYRYQRQARKEFHVVAIRMEDLGDLSEFLRECIGEF